MESRKLTIIISYGSKDRKKMEKVDLVPNIQENYNTTRYRTPQIIPLANYERNPGI